MTYNLKTFALAAVCATLLSLTGCGEKKAEEKKAAAAADTAATEMASAEKKVAEAKAAADKAAAEAKAAADKMAAEKAAVEKAAAPAKKQAVTLGDPALTAGIPGSGPLAVEEIKTWLDNAANHAVLEVKLPQGLDVGANDIKGLDKNPLTRAKIELGRQLYFDTRLSKDNTISCASCHAPDQGFAAHTQFGIGVDGQQGGRNSPVSYNRILSDLQFWDGRAGSLEAQAVGPIANPIEMANTHEAAVATVRGIEGYQLQFAKVFPGSSDSPVTIDNIGAAIASFERTIVSGPSPYDFNEKLRSFAGADLDDMKKDDPDLYKEYEAAKAAADKSPMSDSAKRGRELFFTEKANCTACHVGPNLADEKYHNIGVGMKAEKPDQGRYDVTKDDKDRGDFKTPTVRNVALSAPYMHDGATKTLLEVVEFYAKGGEPNATLDPKIKKLELSDQDKADLVAFMEACTGPFPKIETTRLPK